MRKVPDNVPNTEMLRQHLQEPLTSVPDPFGEYPSFGDHNNAMLRRFDVDWAALGAQLHRIVPDASFIPEIWMGHVNNGEGFFTALDRLEKWL